MGSGKVSITGHRRARALICADVAARSEPRSPAPAKYPAAVLRRTRMPASSSIAARNRLQSMRENRQTPSHDYACCTYRSRTSSEFIKTFGIGFSERGGLRARSGPRTKTLKCVSKENTGAKQTQKRCNRLNHRKNPSRPGPNSTTCHRAQSKGFRGATEDPAGVMLWHNSFVGERNRARAGGGDVALQGRKRVTRSFSPRSALPRPKLNAELTSTRHCGIKLWGAQWHTEPTMS